MTNADPSDTIAYLARVRGLVQGVWFRASMRERARQQGVAGWVRNEPDGSLTTHLEGPAEGVERVLAWIRAGGPAAADVEDVSVETVGPEGLSDFEVTR